MKTIVAIILLCLLIFAFLLKISPSVFPTLPLVLLPIVIQLLYFPKDPVIDLRPLIGVYALFFCANGLVKIMAALSVIKVTPSEFDTGLNIAFVVSGVLTVGCTFLHFRRVQNSQTPRLKPPTIADCLSERQRHR